MTHDKPVKFAIVGCGAVAGAHVPVIAESDAAETVMTVDKSLERAQSMAEENGIPKAVADYRDIVGVADAAVLALPHSLHAPISCDLLRAGVHVLVEKPMALTTEECDAMIDAAREGNATLAVGQLRRFFYSSQFVKRAVDSGMLGEIESFDMREGSVYNWPMASDFTFRADAGGGVLADQGAHSLDTLLWWLGDYAKLECFDDAQGGVEADCEIHLTLESGATGIVELSRTRDLRGSVIIRGSLATIEVESKFDSDVRLCPAGQDILLAGRTLRDEAPGEDVMDVFRRQLADFVDAVRNGRDPLVSGVEGRRAVAAIEAAHACRQPLVLPWAD